MMLVLLLQFEMSRLDVPVVGRPTIASPFSFSQTRIDVPVIGRPTTSAGFAPGWSFSAYRARLAGEMPPALQVPYAFGRAAPVLGSAVPTTSTMLQSMVMLTPPSAPSVVGASPAAAPATAAVPAAAATPAEVVAGVGFGAGAGVGVGARAGP